MSYTIFFNLGCDFGSQGEEEQSIRFNVNKDIKAAAVFPEGDGVAFILGGVRFRTVFDHKFFVIQCLSFPARAGTSFLKSNEKYEFKDPLLVWNDVLFRTTCQA